MQMLESISIHSKYFSGQLHPAVICLVPEYSLMFKVLH